MPDSNNLQQPVDFFMSANNLLADTLQLLKETRDAISKVRLLTEKLGPVRSYPLPNPHKKRRYRELCEMENMMQRLASRSSKLGDREGTLVTAYQYYKDTISRTEENEADLKLIGEGRELLRSVRESSEKVFDKLTSLVEILELIELDITGPHHNQTCD